jgi:pimeloyl-ACP methyl ester carboxylesterase
MGGFERGWRTVAVRGRPTTYLEVGSGPVLLFLHGWGLGYDSYRTGLARLSDLGVRVIAPAMPGFGGTADLRGADFSLGGYAAWVADFLDAIDVDEPVTMVGHSFGGGVAIQTAHDFPERVDRLVLVNSIGGSAWHRGSVVRTLAERPLWDWGLHFHADLFPRRQITRVLPVLLEGLVPNVARNPRSVWRVAGLARRADLTAELDQLRERQLPVVIVWGESDQIIPPEALGSLRQALGEAEVVTVPGSHCWLIADPAAFCEVMTNIVGLTAKGPRGRPTRRAAS